MKLFKEKTFFKPITNAKIFRGFLYCFLGAVFLTLWLSTKAEVQAWWSHLFLLGGLFFLLDYKKKIMLLFFFCLLGLFLGSWRTASELKMIYSRPAEEFSEYVYVDQSPEIKEDYQKIFVCPIEINGKNKQKNILKIKPNCGEKILTFSDLETEYELGEVLKIECQLKNPENREGKFNYIKFLAKDRVYQICQGSQIKKIDKNRYQLTIFYKTKNFVFQKIFELKNQVEEKIKQAFSYPASAYLAGLLLGGEDRLPLEVQENFRRTGTTHTIAVSGFNITILAGFFMWLGILVGFFRQKAFWVAVLGVIFFVLMIGSPSSAVRAAVMGILLLWASKKGRLVDSVWLVMLAAALMIFVSPLDLFYDVGFQLSFLASLSIVLIYGPLSEKFNIKSDFLELKSILLVTISAQLGVLGILLYTFETFSPISLLANLLILPWIPAMMLTGFLTVFVAFFIPFLAAVIALPTQLALDAEIFIIKKLAEIPWASLEIGDIGVLGLVGYYFLFLIVVKMLRRD